MPGIQYFPKAHTVFRLTSRSVEKPIQTDANTRKDDHSDHR